MARRIYKRDKIGRFAKVAGSGSAKAKTRVKPKAAKGPSRSKKRAEKYGSSKKSANAEQLKARKARNKSRAKKAAIAGGVVAGTAAVLYADNRNQARIMKKSAAYNYSQVTHVSKDLSIETRTIYNPHVLVGSLEDVKFIVKNPATIKSLRHRPTLKMESAAIERRYYKDRSRGHKDTLVGMMSGDLSRHKIAQIDNIYVSQRARGTGLMGHLAGAAAPLGEGRTIKASQFRSDAGDATAKKYLSGKEVTKRAKQSAARDNITKNMEANWSGVEYEFFQKRVARMRKEAARGSKVKR